MKFGNHHSLSKDFALASTLRLDLLSKVPLGEKILAIFVKSVSEMLLLEEKSDYDLSVRWPWALDIFFCLCTQCII